MEGKEKRFLDRFDKDSARAEEGTNPFMHDANLYDENEDRAGERYDLATGKPIDNSGEIGLEKLPTADEIDGAIDPETDDDEAARWLRENDPNLQG